MSTDFVGADTAAELVSAWDRGQLVPTIEMGGIGPGYEQALQALMIELLRCGDVSKFEEVARRESREWGHFSGAQVGAASNLAARVLKVGMVEARKEVDAERHILISTAWPMKPPSTATVKP